MLFRSEGRNGPDLLASVEKVRLSAGADTLKISANANLSGVELVDALTQAPHTKDVLDLSSFSGTVTFNGAIDVNGTSFKNFEKLILSDAANTVKITSLTDLGSLQEQVGSFRRRSLRPSRECLRGSIHRGAAISARSCRDAGKQLSAIGLVNLEDLIVCSFAPLVVGKIAILLHLTLRGLHYS